MNSTGCCSAEAFMSRQRNELAEEWPEVEGTGVEPRLARMSDHRPGVGNDRDVRVCRRGAERQRELRMKTARRSRGWPE